MKWNAFPRIGFTEHATPLQPLSRLSDHLGGPKIFIKRDDLTGLAGGGNKARKLEYLAADALAQGADTLIATGATQSNHARQTAAAAAQLGLDCILLLERRLQGQPAEYYRAGNALLNRVLGATLCEELPAGANIATAVAELETQLIQQGRKPYVVAAGGSSPLGAMGYVGCAHEITTQASDLGIKVDYIVHAAGSGGTQAGLVAALCRHKHTRVRGYSVRFDSNRMSAIVHAIANQTTSLMDAPSVRADRIEVDDTHIGDGYGIATPEALDAIKLLGRQEGILLDPVYTGKAMAGLIADIHSGRFSADQNIVFLHTGGAAVLSAYTSLL
ncbi:D-cysteine desulfhydrase [Advenella sp. S44]|uniref:D-cysteine desulfhydrase n=1 Tax=Advenella sp. S44 TaxID=1982755 RepID=UPI000C2A2E30|nr:D-cysteine desulfhydrase [Advenella sp. S44]PJX20285.1 D-cysteine desulfhydrase [Advenella sp. S44]